MLNIFSEFNTTNLIKYIKQNYDASEPLILGVDLFCGAGGMTEGYSRNKNFFIVIILSLALV